MLSMNSDAMHTLFGRHAKSISSGSMASWATILCDAFKALQAIL